MPIKLTTPLTKDKLASLRAGDEVLLTGTIYTARDAAHRRIAELLLRAEEPPFELRDAAVYYAGPTPARPGEVCGSFGPTTSSRMDAYTPALLERGMSAMIGKGERAQAVVESIAKHGAVYFGAIGGIAALGAKCVAAKETIAFHDLDSEAVCRVEVRDMPLTVLVDSRGGNYYRLGAENYLKSKGKK
ncbi:MAG TPA: Fe-S-containing hydro-lyase [Clostridia bacterium]|nr:Fe-S-containing hydro-lyase [Clostridia bacterium]